MTFPLITLPHQETRDSLNHIPGPSASDFDAEFAGILPAGETILSSYGSTHLYVFAPTCTPTGRNFIILHGGGTSAIGVSPLALALAQKGETVVIYDSWGHGCSSTPLAPHTPALYHHQLLEVMLHLQWTSAHVIGFSAGGGFAASFAVSHPKAVESVILLAPSGLLRKSDRSWYEALIQDGGWGLEWLSSRKIVDMVEEVDKQPEEGWKERLKEGKIDTIAVQKWEREMHSGHEASIVGIWRDGGVFDLHDTYRELAKGKAKKVVVLGSKDTVFEEDYMRRQLQDVGWKVEDIRIVNEATHQIIRSHVKEVADIVLEFLKDPEAESG